MSAENKKSKAKNYKLIILCGAALALGCAIPLIALTSHNGTSKNLLLAMECLGGLALAYVFTFFLLKK